MPDATCKISTDVIARKVIDIAINEYLNCNFDSDNIGCYSILDKGDPNISFKKDYTEKEKTEIARKREVCIDNFAKVLKNYFEYLLPEKGEKYIGFNIRSYYRTEEENVKLYCFLWQLYEVNKLSMIPDDVCYHIFERTKIDCFGSIKGNIEDNINLIRLIFYIFIGLCGSTDFEYCKDLKMKEKFFVDDIKSDLRVNNYGRFLINFYCLNNNIFNYINGFNNPTVQFYTQGEYIIQYIELMKTGIIDVYIRKWCLDYNPLPDWLKSYIIENFIATLSHMPENYFFSEPADVIYDFISFLNLKAYKIYFENEISIRENVNIDKDEPKRMMIQDNFIEKNSELVIDIEKCKKFTKDMVSKYMENGDIKPCVEFLSSFYDGVENFSVGEHTKDYYVKNANDKSTNKYKVNDFFTVTEMILKDMSFKNYNWTKRLNELEIAFYRFVCDYVLYVDYSDNCDTCSYTYTSIYSRLNELQDILWDCMMTCDAAIKVFLKKIQAN